MFDSMGVLGWIISIIGTIGVAGTIALAFLAPQLLLVLWKGALELLARILSTRIGCAAIAFLVGAVIFDFYGDNSGAARIQAEWDAAKVEYARELAELTQKVDSHERQHVARARADEERATREQAERLAAYTAALPRSNTSCDGITDRELDLARGLQNDRPGKRRWFKTRDRDQ